MKLNLKLISINLLPKKNSQLNRNGKLIENSHGIATGINIIFLLM